MESRPSKDQTKSPGRHRNARESAGKLTLFDSANGVWKWVDGFRKPWDEWRISITAVIHCQKQTLIIVHEKVSSSKSVHENIAYPKLYSFGFKEPQHRAADRTWIHWCTTSGKGIKSGVADAMVSSMVQRNCFQPLKWYHHRNEPLMIPFMNHFIHFQPQSFLWCFQQETHGAIMVPCGRSM